MEYTNHILATAVKAFLHYGFKNVTVDDIARKAGISKKTFYETFKNKDAIVFEALKFHTMQNVHEMEAISKKAKNAVEELVGIFVHMGKMLKGMNPICLSDVQRYYPQAALYMEEFKQGQMYKSIANNLLRGKEEGLFRDTLDVDIITRYRMEMFFLTIQSNTFQQKDFDIVKVNKEIVELYMYGIATLKGHKLITKYLEKIND